MAQGNPPNSAADEYELVPRNQLEYLRREVEQIKRNPFGDSKSSKDLLSSMDALNRNIEKFVAILESANDEIVRDYKDKSNAERMNRLLDQNEKLAKGIVAIAELLKELKELREERQQASASAFPIPNRPGPQPEQSPSAQMWQTVTPPPNLPQNPFLDAPPPGGPQAKPRLPFDFSEVPPPP
jgi:hypothetical protein